MITFSRKLQEEIAEMAQTNILNERSIRRTEHEKWMGYRDAEETRRVKHEDDWKNHADRIEELTGAHHKRMEQLTASHYAAMEAIADINK